MAVPRSKVTRSKRNMRRAHLRLKRANYIEDPESGELHRPHHIEPKTGMYRGRQVLPPRED